jgi:prolipoprotein diacylglyceryl transferase
MYPTLSHFIHDVTGWWVPLPIQTFGFFVAIAIIVAYKYLDKELKRKERSNMLIGSYNDKGTYRKPGEQASVIIILALVFGIIGARIFSILEYPGPFLEAPLYILFSPAGFTFYGGLIFGSVAVWVYARRIKLRITPLLDAAAPSLMIGYAIGRLGCHFSGDGDWGIDNLWGKPNVFNSFPDWLWSYRYPHNVIEEGIAIPGCTGPFCMQLPNPVFPTPLYESIFCFIAFLVLWKIRKTVLTPGVLFCIYLIVNGVERYLIEQIRVDAEYNLFGANVKQAEIIAIILILVGITGYYTSRKSQKYLDPNYINFKHD